MEWNGSGTDREWKKLFLLKPVLMIYHAVFTHFRTAMARILLVPFTYSRWHISQGAVWWFRTGKRIVSIADEGWRRARGDGKEGVVRISFSYPMVWRESRI